MSATPFTPSNDPNVIFYTTPTVIPISILTDWVNVITQISGLSSGAAQLQAQQAITDLNAVINLSPNTYAPSATTILGNVIYETMFVLNIFDVNNHGAGVLPPQLYQRVKSEVNSAWCQTQIGYYTKNPELPLFYP